MSGGQGAHNCTRAVDRRQTAFAAGGIWQQEAAVRAWDTAVVSHANALSERSACVNSLVPFANYSRGGRPRSVTVTGRDRMQETPPVRERRVPVHAFRCVREQGSPFAHGGYPFVNAPRYRTGGNI